MRASAPAHRISDNTHQKARPWRTTARPLAIQRLAAGLVATTHGLDRTHIGAICDALTAAGVDPAVWSARAVNDKLNADMRTRGLTWPDHIANPGAFLHSRLRRLSWSPPDPPTQGGVSAAARIDQTPTPVVLTDAARARIAAAQHEIRRVLRDSAQRTHKDARPAGPTGHQHHQRDWPPATPSEDPSSGYVHTSGSPGIGHPRSTMTRHRRRCRRVHR